jgi:leader peptidase (prepilin peptidase)/N-methyltransferase
MACAAVAFGAAAHTPALLAVLLAGCWLLLLMALIDAGSGYLPDVLTLPFFILGGVHALLLPVPGALVQAGTGVLVAVLLPLLAMAVFWCRHRCAGLGWGDVKLLAGMGVWLGVQGVVLALLLACVSGVCYALVGWWRNRACGPSPGLVAYPFGPFLAAAAGAMLLVFAVAPDARKAVLQCHHYTWPASCVTVPIL